MNEPFHVAVVGAGPAGFYTAADLLGDSDTAVRVDMIERLPTPWGLVRSGVAPDHPGIKSVSENFAETAQHPHLRFFGNVQVGRDITREELADRYDAVVYATGMDRGRRLGIPGEDLPGVFTAGEVVGWYNGHPDHSHLPIAEPLLRTDATVVVIGNGNVALDVARILGRPPTDLEATDIADGALAVLRRATVRRILVLGRRGAGHSRFTTPELRVLAGIDRLQVVVDAAELECDESSRSEFDPRGRRNLDVLQQLSAAEPRRHPATRTVEFRFHQRPEQILGTDRVEAVRVATSRPGRSPVRETIPAALCVTAIGYDRGSPIGLPLESSGTVAHTAGRVRGADHEYVAGWVKRGPSGVIGTNKLCARETVDAVLADLRARHSSTGNGTGRAAALEGWLFLRHPDVVTQDDWLRIDRHERALGQASGRPRVKACTTTDLLTIARSVESTGVDQSGAQIRPSADRRRQKEDPMKRNDQRGTAS